MDHMTLLKKVTGAINAARPSVRNARVLSWSPSTMMYKSSLHRPGKPGVKEELASTVLEPLGFVRARIEGGPSAKGDFSSDVYGNKYRHPGGASVEVAATFRMGADISVVINATPEQLALIKEPPT